MKFLITFIPLLLISLSSFAYQGQELFTKKPKLNSISAKHTFIFWINGDAERFRPTTTNYEVSKIDKFDIEQVRKAAINCKCNVVLFYDQRGTDYWYTAQEAWGSFIEVYQNGKRVNFEKTVKRKRHKRNIEVTYKNEKEGTAEVNQASTDFLKDLISYGTELFPKSSLHLVYRGHSFARAYKFNNEEMVSPFDYSAIETDYSTDHFIESFDKLNLKKKLGSITFAACTMSYLDLLTDLSLYTNYVIASQIPILETIDAGFDLSFMNQVVPSDTDFDISKKIHKTLLSRFSKDAPIDNIIRETLMTWINTEVFKENYNQIKELLQEVKNMDSQFKNVVVTVKPSQNYLDRKKESGTKQKTIDILRTNVNFESVYRSVDFGALITSDPTLMSNYKTLIDDIFKSIELDGYSDFSHKTGINIMIEAR